MKVYIYNKCSTCTNALRFLKKHQVTFSPIEITLTPPTIAELKQMLEYKQGSIKKLFNTSGNLYKELELSKKLDAMSLNQALELLSQNGMLVKRPFVIGNDFGLTGFNQKEWAEKFESLTHTFLP